MPRLAYPSRQVLHLLALSAFAIAQPLFDVLGRDATFFVAQGSSVTHLLFFAALVLLGPPLVIVACIRLAGMLWPPAGSGLYLAAIGALAGLTVAPPVTSLLRMGTVGWLAIFVAVGVLALLAYVRWSRFREVLTWAAAAPMVFLAVFLLGGPVRHLLLPARVQAQVERAGGSVKANVPVVMLVFDELPLGSLLRPDGTIDSRRYPNFARLAASSTWYPNTTTNAEQTSRVIPALLTGQLPESNKIPAASAYPDNLFTLLGGAYRIHATEFITRMCPPGTCIGPPDRASFGSLLSDAGIVYLHAALPADLAEARLPALGDQWTGFGAPAAPDAEAFAEWRQADAVHNQINRFASIVGRISRAESPALWYVHIGLPHEPWRFLPTMQTYAGHSRPGLQAHGQWASDQAAVDHSLQRYLLQLQFADRLLGRLLDRVRSAGLYDESLLFVLADHGASFRPGSNRRALDGENAAEILPVPLLVKYPGQQQQRVDRRNAELIDVLPTIADVLGIRVPWTVDGASLRSDAPERRQKRVFLSRQERIQRFGRVIDGVDGVSRRIQTLFGPAGGDDDLYRFGPHRDLVGRPVSALHLLRTNDRSAQARLEDVAAYLDVEPKGPFIPALLGGTVTGVNASTPIAVALNGTIAGTGWTYRDKADVKVGIMVSPRYFSRGKNTIELYRVAAAGELIPVPRASQLIYRAIPDDEGNVVGIQASNGQTLSLETDGFGGMVDRVSWTSRTVSIDGWAADLARKRVPTAFLIVYEGQVIQIAETRRRTDVARHFNSKALTDAGLAAHVAPTLAPDEGAIQVYAVFEDAAYLMPRGEKARAGS
ncbi:MAG: sulfatase-like hydrolase/transferase [Vicinamibacteraceae bacterium]